MKSINARVTEKTTADLYYFSHFGLYTGYCQSSYLSFHGTQADKLRKKLAEFMVIKDKEYKSSFEDRKSREIAELQKQLSSVVDGWFKKPSKELKKKLKEAQDKQWYGIDEFGKYIIYTEFLSILNAVKISRGESHTIYEILPLPKSNNSNT